MVHLTVRRDLARPLVAALAAAKQRLEQDVTGALAALKGRTAGAGPKR